MIVIVGCIVVIGCVLLGFSMAGGHVGALIHPSEIVTIGGASLGALIVMSPKKVLVDMFRGILQTLKGSPFNKDSYKELLQCHYDLMRVGRREGLLALEGHLVDPTQSAIFTRYPKIVGNSHVLHFICDGFGPLVDGSARGEDLPDMFEAEIHAMEAEHHAPAAALSKTADALPGFGIVAAVLGIVVTMGHIDGPVEEIGHKVGAALVGTFLGILLSYGFFAPLAARMETQSHTEITYFRTIANMIMSFASDVPPKVVIERTRRSMPSDLRPSREELEQLLAEVDSK